MLILCPVFKAPSFAVSDSHSSVTDKQSQVSATGAAPLVNLLYPLDVIFCSGYCLILGHWVVPRVLTWFLPLSSWLASDLLDTVLACPWVNAFVLGSSDVRLHQHLLPYFLISCRYSSLPPRILRVCLPKRPHQPCSALLMFILASTSS